MHILEVYTYAFMLCKLVPSIFMLNISGMKNGQTLQCIIQIQIYYKTSEKEISAGTEIIRNLIQDLVNWANPLQYFEHFKSMHLGLDNRWPDACLKLGLFFPSHITLVLTHLFTVTRFKKSTIIQNFQKITLKRKHPVNEMAQPDE